MLSFMVVLQKTFFLQNCYKFLSSTANVHHIWWMLVKTTFNEYPQFIILSKKWVKLMFNLCKPHFSPYKMMDLLTWYYRFLWKNMTQFYFSETIVDFFLKLNLRATETKVICWHQSFDTKIPPSAPTITPSSRLNTKAAMGNPCKESFF